MVFPSHQASGSVDRTLDQESRDLDLNAVSETWLCQSEQVITSH